MYTWAHTSMFKVVYGMPLSVTPFLWKITSEQLCFSSYSFYATLSAKSTNSFTSFSVFDVMTQNVAEAISTHGLVVVMDVAFPPAQGTQTHTVSIHREPHPDSKTQGTAGGVRMQSLSEWEMGGGEVENILLHSLGSCTWLGRNRWNSRKRAIASWLGL